MSGRSSVAIFIVMTTEEKIGGSPQMRLVWRLLVGGRLPKGLR